MSACVQGPPVLHAAGDIYSFTFPCGWRLCVNAKGHGARPAAIKMLHHWHVEKHAGES